MRLRTPALAACAVTLAVAPLASAHVTLQPGSAPAGSFTRLDVRVPNERDDASTTRIRVQFPPGVVFASVEPVPGWTTTVQRVPLETPVEAFGETFTKGIGTITYRAAGRGIGPGEFQDFGVSMRTPDGPDTRVAFKALQTYSSGEVVRWIEPVVEGAEEPEFPAPTVALTPPVEESADAFANEPATPEIASASTGSSDDGKVNAALGLGIGGLVLGAGGLAVGLRGRRRQEG